MWASCPSTVKIKKIVIRNGTHCISNTSPSVVHILLFCHLHRQLLSWINQIHYHHFQSHLHLFYILCPRKIRHWHHQMDIYRIRYITISLLFRINSSSKCDNPKSVCHRNCWNRIEYPIDKLNDQPQCSLIITQSNHRTAYFDTKYRANK